MKKFEKFEINNQQSIVRGKKAEPTKMTDGRSDLWDSDKKRFIILR